ncbi:MAG: signal peptidase II [Chloroflexi bacterium]|nr:signal peptidase II [Chloroflexota bacterium]MBI3741847.1 signal peptidase II [Chloroflexota bacterium]
MKFRDLILFFIAFIVFIADQFSKAWTRENIPLNATREIIPNFDWFVLTHITNSGAAFGLFPQAGIFFTLIALVVSFAIVAYYRSLPTGQWLVRISLGLQLGGALGNLVDRLRTGYVVDMLYARFWPVFNIADSAIVCGVVVLMWHLLRNSPKEDVVPLPNDAPEKIETSSGR